MTPTSEWDEAASRSVKLYTFGSEGIWEWSTHMSTFRCDSHTLLHSASLPLCVQLCALRVEAVALISMRDDGGQDQWRKVDSFQAHFQIRRENWQDLLMEGHQRSRMRGKNDHRMSRMKEKVIKMIFKFLCGVIGPMSEMSLMREGRYKAGGRESSVLYQTHNNCVISVRCDVSIRWVDMRAESS